MAFPTLENAEEIHQYILSSPTASLETNEILKEIKHWQKLFNERYWIECHKPDPGIAGRFFVGEVI
jgi:hypothetical protein